MGSGSMRVHQFARGLISWDQQHEPSLTLGHCKRLRPLIPKNNPTTNSDITNTNTNTATTTAPIPFDLKSFIKPNSGPNVSPSDLDKRDQFTPVETTHPGGTRWNPTQEQIGILEMLYMGGMRTPNAQQIEQITQQLGKYGKIEGKNVFYWFQNHKARKRQKQKRSNLGLMTQSPRSSSTSFSTITVTTRDVQEFEERPLFKKKCRTWSFESLEEEEQKNKTLELFPLHPELHRKIN